MRYKKILDLFNFKLSFILEKINKIVIDFLHEKCVFINL